MYSDQKMLKRVYYKALLPNMIAILGGTVNVFFDGIMVGQRMGELGIASINQSLAVYLLLCTFGSLIAAGSSALSAQSMGDDRQQEARDYYSLALELAFLVGILVCFLGFIFCGRLARFLGTPDSAAMVEAYIRITMFGGVFKVLLYVPYFYLRLEGRVQKAAVSMTTMTVLNILLDYLFLFLFDLGIAGAAWASNIATAVACVMCFYFISARDSNFHFHPVFIKWNMLSKTVRYGSPMAANNLFSSLRLLSLNNIMSLAGGSTMVAVFAITNNLNEFSICIQNGVPQAGSAMMGIYNGEQDTLSVKKLLKMQLEAGAVTSLIFGLLLVIFSPFIGPLFGSSQDVRWPVLCLAVGIVLATLNSVMCYYYYSTMQTGIADFITITRGFGAAVGTAWLLRGTGEGIWLFYFLGEIVTLILWVAVCLIYSRIKQGRANLFLLDETALKEGKSIGFTVACDAAAICEASEKIHEFCEVNSFDADQTMTISLALEELMVITADKSMDNQGTMDVRILRLPDGGILRIRSEGRRYNPLENADESLEFLGVTMIMKMAKKNGVSEHVGAEHSDCIHLMTKAL
ncbi:MAG: polysaccharide biosynthesis C-terminal domain-containing protein [Lachnospiraceae bacterium]|nr:polysaccharide biosynthesis C-terminal domain-containing protein [Lachnospiraceae bacterium]